MLNAMMHAPVGDDVFGEDPSVNRLQQMAADMFGKEAALYCPTGTMSNQVAIKCHTQPGDEVICEKQAHVYIYEGGGIAFHSGSQVKAIEGDRGRIHANEVQELINPEDVHKAHTSLVCLENTSNRGGGSCYDFKEIENIKEVCVTNNLKLHLDGARLFNAIVAKNENPLQYGNVFDSISVCLNKGLGCPIGSILIGSNEFIRKAKRVRKVFGGGMRQAGYMAAAGIYALENNIERLDIDHQYAVHISHELLNKEFIGHMMPIETNIIIFEVVGKKYTAKSLAAAFQTFGILCIPISPTQIRMVTHLDITENMVHQTIDAIHKL